ncbi:MAG: glycosyltransferase family 2 protein [Coleofasciculus sp. G3-WIS-01]|uniref:glycosyltransferase family 2 protein n=1 Tax=Coleofasciculus sp. G3-WIS-01 TaxID=3069528 RepID=UPI0032F81B93
MDKVGVVTVTFNSQNVIEEFLDSIFSQSHENFKLYVIDNASADKTLTIINFYHDRRILTINNLNNRGVAAGNNQGIEAALKDDCNYILLINNDTVFSSDLISQLLKVIRENNCSMATPKMMYHSRPNVIWCAGGFFRKTNGYLPENRGLNHKDIGQFNCVERVDYAPTCCTLIKKEVFEDIGLMDEKYFVYADEVDFFYRVWKNGKHLMYYTPNTKLYHKVGALTQSMRGIPQSKYAEFYLRYTTRNNIYFLKKQNTLYSKFFIAYYFVKMPFSFLLTGRYNRNLKTFLLLQKSFVEGLFL